MAEYLQLTQCIRCRRLTANLKGECVRCLGRAVVSSRDVSKIVGGDRVCDRGPVAVHTPYGGSQRAGGGIRILRKNSGNSCSGSE